ncbi:MAG: DUF4397 domain-containing protein [Kofleriaceae bacterium]|nr:DUF4397 domain-containing protein [Kofleriaceae bacterium]
MRHLMPSVLLSLAVIPVAACGDDDPGDPTPAGKATIRVVHASPDAPAVDVYAAGSTTPLVEDLAYGETSATLEVDEGTYDLEVRAAGAAADSAPAYTTGPLDLAADAHVTALAAGYLGSTDAADRFRVIPLADGFAAPGADEAIVRIVHASADAPTVAIDVGNDGSPEIAALDRFADTGATGVALPAGQALPIGIWAGDPLTRVTSFTTPPLPAGAELYVIASGNLGDLPRQATGFALLAVGDAGTITAIKQDPSVYVFHGSPDAPAVDVLAGGAALAQNLAFGELSAPIQVPPGSYDLDVNVAGTTTTAATITTPALAAGERYLAIASGFVGAGEEPFQPIYAADAFALGDAGARVAVIHASPDAPAVDVGPLTGLEMAAPAPVQDLAFAEQTDGAGLALPAGTITLGVAAAGSSSPVATFDVPLTAGQRAFVVAAGALSPVGDQEPFRLFAIDTAAAPWALAEVAPN